MFLSDCNQSRFPHSIFMTFPNSKFHVNPSSGSRTDICRPMDISKQMRVATMRTCPIPYNVAGGRKSVVSTAVRLGAGRTRARIPAGSRNFSLLHNAQTGCGAHSAFYSAGVVVLSWRQRGVAMRLITHLHLMARLRISGVTPLLLQAFMAWTGTTLPLTHDQTTAGDCEETQMIRPHRGTEKTQMIRPQRGTVKRRR